MFAISNSTRTKVLKSTGLNKRPEQEKHDEQNGEIVNIEIVKAREGKCTFIIQTKQLDKVI